MMEPRPKASRLSLPVALVTLVLISSRLSSLSSVAGDSGVEPVDNSAVDNNISLQSGNVTDNFPSLDCDSYKSCTQCVSSGFPCDWCLYGDKCTDSISQTCHDDFTVNRASKIGQAPRSGPDFCPRTEATHPKDILIPSGTRKSIRVKVHLTGNLFIIVARFVCRFNIEGRVIRVTAILFINTIYCDPTEFSYTSKEPNITVPVTVIWSESRPLENPNHTTYLVLYSCREMADNCGTCLTQDEKYGCGWCQSSNKCEVKDQCDQGSGVWLNRTQTCPIPEIHSFEPQSGPWEGGTNVTIRGINLGNSFTDIYAGVSIAGLPCHPYREHYVRSKQIVCRVDSPGTAEHREGPVIVWTEYSTGNSSLNYEFVDPVITSMSPKYAPKSGRTVVKITGRYMNAGSKIQASIDNLPCSIIYVTVDDALCLTSASNEIRGGVLKMKFDDWTREYDEVFEYVDDPIIESVESGFGGSVKIPKGIPAGGIKVSVTGRNLGYVEDTRMYVYYNKDKVFVSIKCETSNQTNMVCSSPSIEIANDVLDADNPLSLEYGFLMDDVPGVQNLSARGFNRFLLYPDPIYEEFDGGVEYYQDEYLTIRGQNLDRACQESDVIVQIGNSFCNVTSLSRQQLTCRPPPTQPSALNSEGLADDQELPEVVVVVGDLRKSIGKLSYVSSTTPALKTDQ